MHNFPSGKSGPLKGIRIVEFAGIGPAPYAGMLLADLGADVVRIDRFDAPQPDPGHQVLGRGRRSIALNLKQPKAIELVHRCLQGSDGLIEGFRPGVMERLGLGPEQCHAINARLVYGRVTGWGQDGPLANAPGHDINYIALTGLLNAIGTPASGPVAPLNLLGDFAGGGLFLAFGMLAAIIEARSSGRGQVVDAAMIDGASSLGSLIWGMRSGGWWPAERGRNMLDGGSHFYGVFECADGKWITLASIEPPFYAALLKVLQLDPARFAEQMNPSQWAELRGEVAAAIRQRTRDEWTSVLEGSELCFAPVLDFDEALAHPHNQARGLFERSGNLIYPRAVPQFSRTPGVAATPTRTVGDDGRSILAELGFSSEEISSYESAGVVRRCSA